MSGNKAARWCTREEEEEQQQRILLEGRSWNSADLLPHTMIADMFRSSSHSSSDPTTVHAIRQQITYMMNS